MPSPTQPHPNSISTVQTLLSAERGAGAQPLVPPEAATITVLPPLLLNEDHWQAFLVGLASPNPSPSGTEQCRKAWESSRKQCLGLLNELGSQTRSWDLGRSLGGGWEAWGQREDCSLSLKLLDGGGTMSSLCLIVVSLCFLFLRQSLECGSCQNPDSQQCQVEG